MDNLDVKQRQKQFFKTIFEPMLQDSQHTDSKSSYLNDGEHIRLLQVNDKSTNTGYFNNIDDLLLHLSKKQTNYTNSYFTLATTTGQGGTKEHLVKRSVLGFDFDKKDFNEELTPKKIMFMFNEIGLFYHSIVDTGNGFHVYVMIQPTDNIDKVQAVQEELGRILKADNQALKPTQLLRIPYTYNVKQQPRKTVNIVKLYEKDNIKRKSIDYLYNMYCTYGDTPGNESTKYIQSATNIPECINEILENGSPKGKRYEDLKKIVVTLRKRNKTLNQIHAVVEEWAYKSDYNDNLDYRTDSIYNNLNYVKLDCKGCRHYNKCYHKQEETEQQTDDEAITVSESRMRTLRTPKRRGAKTMNGNDLLIYGILLFHKDGLYRNELIEELTYQEEGKEPKQALSRNTIKKSLNNLKENNYIEINKRTKFYKVKPIRTKIDLMFGISYNATIHAIKGEITTEELRLYSFMVYLQNKQQREDINAPKGNKLRVNQMYLAKELGVTQGRISQMIENLLNKRVLGIAYRERSKNNSFMYNTYRIGKIC